MSTLSNSVENVSLIESLNNDKSINNNKELKSPSSNQNLSGTTLYPKLPELYETQCNYSRSPPQIIIDPYINDNDEYLAQTSKNSRRFIIIPANLSTTNSSNPAITISTSDIVTTRNKSPVRNLNKIKFQNIPPTTLTSLQYQLSNNNQLPINEMMMGSDIESETIIKLDCDNNNKSVNEQQSVNSVCGNNSNNNNNNNIVDSNNSVSFIVGDGDNDFNNMIISQSDAIHQQYNLNQLTTIPATMAAATTATPATAVTTTIMSPTYYTTNTNRISQSISCNFPITTSISQTKLGVVNLRPKLHNSSMRSVVSAHLSSADNDQQQMSLQSPTTNRIIRTSSYIFGDSNAKIFSDATSIRSLASIGVGSTDGRKLVIRRVPNSPNELLNIVNPSPLLKEPLGDDDSDSYGYNSDDPDSSNLKPRRQHWENKMQFVLACIGYSVGLGNVWRFPYMCYKSGGGVFLVPYFIILIICSTPMLYMELAVGQYTGRGPIGALGQICPLFKGAGFASVVVSFLMSTYYSVIIAYSIYYFFTSMKPDLPWTGCNNRWNSIDCWIPARKNANMTPSDLSRTPSEEFFENKVLQISNGIEFPGLMRWELFACLICAWLLVYFATWKSIKSSAKVRYFTATFPFVLIIVLMGRALTLEGADDGLRYFFRPQWSELGNANVWINACSQNFNSLGIAFGTMISFASYNKYTNNILYDTLAVSAVNALTSILVGIFAFATLGNLAWELNTSVKDVISDGPGFIFVVYPQVMAKMPYAQLWAVMFFFMLLCLGLNSQFAIVEVVVTSIQDGFPNWIKRNLVYHEVLVLIVCVVSFLFGLPNIIQGGIYFFQLMDHYAASISIMFLAFFQMIAISWFYGAGRLSKNVKQMTGKAPALYLKTCWLIVGPFLLISLWIFSLINYQEPTYHNGNYVYPPWAYGIGWLIASLSLVCIPAYGIINIARASGKNLCDKLLNSMKPNIYQCPICGEHHCEHDFPEEQYILETQELPIIQPKILLKTPPPGHQSTSNPPLLTASNQPNTSVVMEDESSGGQFVDDTKR